MSVGFLWGSPPARRTCGEVVGRGKRPAPGPHYLIRPGRYQASWSADRARGGFLHSAPRYPASRAVVKTPAKRLRPATMPAAVVASDGVRVRFVGSKISMPGIRGQGPASGCPAAARSVPTGQRPHHRRPLTLRDHIIAPILASLRRPGPETCPPHPARRRLRDPSARTCTTSSPTSAPSPSPHKQQIVGRQASRYCPAGAVPSRSATPLSS